MREVLGVTLSGKPIEVKEGELAEFVAHWNLVLKMEAKHQSDFPDVTALDMVRYRYHHGTNLGSIYVLERWLFRSRFPTGAKGTSELAAVEAWVKMEGIEATKARFEKAWESAVSDQDIKWLKEEAHCTTIRLPIGYYDLPGPEFTQGTPFEAYAKVYSAAWHSIRRLICRLRAHSIGVLLDLHALPGGANSREHSGTNSGTAAFFTSPTNRALGVRCCEFIAREAASGLDLVGLEVVNEADRNSNGMYEWYDECVAVISAIEPSLPVIISDGWDLRTAIAYAQKKNTAYPPQLTCPVIVDTHLYWCFSAADAKKSPQQIIEEVPTKLSPLDGKEGNVIERGAAQVIVGEYSNVLSEDTWAKAEGTPRKVLANRFGEEQSLCYQKRTGGAFFWTWKMDWMPGGEWGFKAQSDPQPLIPARSGLGSVVRRAVDKISGGEGGFTKQTEEEPAKAVTAIKPPKYLTFDQHTLRASLSYKRSHGVSYFRDEHLFVAVKKYEETLPNLVSARPQWKYWRYVWGWKVGYHDAYCFFEGKADKMVQPGNMIGFVEAWVLKRVRECGLPRELAEEFEKGLRKGMRDFHSLDD